MASTEISTLSDEEFEFMSILLGRFSYAPLRALLRSLGFDPQVGFNNIKETMPYQFSESSKLLQYDDFKQSYYEHVLFGNKKATFFNFEDSSLIDAVRDNFRSTNLINSTLDRFSSSILPKSDLRSHSMRNPSLVYILDQVDQLHLIYSSVHLYSYREDLPTSNGYSEFDELLGIKNIYNQCFDVITVKDDGFVDVKIDYVKDPEKNKFLANSLFDKNLKYLKSSFNQMMNRGSKKTFTWVQPVNLKMVIDSLSEDTSVKVINLAQMDDSGQISEFSTAQDDVRLNLVRHAGNQVLRDHGDEPKNFAFAGSVSKTLSNLNYHPQLIIKALPRILLDPQGKIDHAIIKDNIGQEEYDLFRNKLLVS